jgi:outer membrane protein assembly factor BamD
MFVRKITTYILVLTFALSLAGAGSAQQGNSLTPTQRLDLLKSQLEGLRAQLRSALSSLPKTDHDGDRDSPRARLTGLDKEVGSTISEVNSLRSKVDRAERFETADLDKVETAYPDLRTRVESSLRDTAGDRSTAAAENPRKKKKKKFLGLFGGGGNQEYEDLTGSVAPGRDRVLFAEGTKEVRKGHFDVGRLLYNTIITAYPDSNFLAFAKLAIADTFYLEGTTSSLIQASAGYQDWLTFFPTDQLADQVMLKVAESEMRQMNIPGLDASHSRKAEQRLKVILQQFPQTKLRPDIEIRLREVQENLAMNNMLVGNQYYVKAVVRGGPGLKGAQWRYREIIDKYPNFSLLDEILYKEGVTYMQEEETDEAAKYFQRIARDYPNGRFFDKAIEQLKIIGAPIPEPSEEGRNRPAPEGEGMMDSIKREVFGYQPVTVEKNGVLIWRNLEEGQRDPILVALDNQGQLPDSRTPIAPQTPQRPRGGN